MKLSIYQFIKTEISFDCGNGKTNKQTLFEPQKFCLLFSVAMAKTERKKTQREKTAGKITTPKKTVRKKKALKKIGEEKTVEDPKKSVRKITAPKKTERKKKVVRNKTVKKTTTRRKKLAIDKPTEKDTEVMEPHIKGRKKTALHEAAERGDSDKLQRLLDEGTYDVNATDGSWNSRHGSLV